MAQILSINATTMMFKPVSPAEYVLLVENLFQQTTIKINFTDNGVIFFKLSLNSGKLLCRSLIEFMPENDCHIQIRLTCLSSAFSHAAIDLKSVY